MTTFFLIAQWIQEHRGLIISIIAALFISILFLVIRIEISKIESLSTQITDLKNRNETLIDQLSAAADDIKTIRQYLLQLEKIAAAERQELSENEQICKNVSDFGDIIGRLNELFGYCANKARSAD